MTRSQARFFLLMGLDDVEDQGVDTSFITHKEMEECLDILMTFDYKEMLNMVRNNPTVDLRTLPCEMN